MKRLLFALLLLVVSGCSIPMPNPDVIFGPPEVPQANVPLRCRQSNWSYRSPMDGSCVHASLMSLMRYQCQPKLADWWGKNHGGGENPDSLYPKLDAAGITYAATFNEGDVEFLEWACRTRRGCAVAIYGRAHMVDLVGLTKDWAIILDNNDTSHFIYVPRETFINEWLWSDSWAVCLLFDPCPPKTQLSSISKGKKCSDDY